MQPIGGSDFRCLFDSDIGCILWVWGASGFSHLIRDRIVLEMKDKSFQERLLREPQLSPQWATEFVRASEASKKQIKFIVEQKSEVEAVRVKRNSFQNSARGFQPANSFQSGAQGFQSAKGSVFDCSNCENLTENEYAQLLTSYAIFVKVSIILLQCVKKTNLVKTTNTDKLMKFSIMWKSV